MTYTTPTNGTIFPATPAAGVTQYRYDAGSAVWVPIVPDQTVTPGTYGTTTSVPQFSVDVSGAIFAAKDISIQSSSTTEPGLVQLVDDTITNDNTKALTASVGYTLQQEINDKGDGTVTEVRTGTGLTGGPITTTGTISLANTTVTAGSYTLGNFSVNAQGQLTAASTTSPASVAVTTVSADGGLTGGGGPGPISLAVGAGTGISVDADSIRITDTTVTAGSYTLSNFTVNAQGQLTAASTTSPASVAVTTVSAGAGLSGGGGPGDVTVDIATGGVVDSMVSPTANIASSKIAFLSAGLGAVSRTLQSVLNESVISVKDFGAVGDDLSDDSSAIQDAVDYATSLNGGIVFFPPGIYRISSTISVTNSNITLLGFGGNQYHDFAPPSGAACVLKWYGAVGGIMVSISSIPGPTLAKINNCGVTGIEFDGRALAGYGLYIISINIGSFERLYVHDTTIASYYVGTFPLGSLAEPTDVQKCVFSRCSWRNIDFPATYGSHGFWLTSPQPVTGFPNGNVSFNSFLYLDGKTAGLAGSGHGIFVEDADNNIFVGVRIFRSFQVVPAIYINGAICNANHWFELSVAGVGATLLANGPGGSVTLGLFLALDTANGTQLPAVEPGCVARVMTDGGDLYGFTVN